MALIPTKYPSTTVAIGVTNAQNNITQWIGTGFFYGKFVSSQNNQSSYNVYLVTNKHVIGTLQRIAVRFDVTTGGTRVIDIDLYQQNRPIWTGHNDTEVDIAIIPINGNRLNELGINYYFFKSESEVLPLSNPIANNLSEGDFIYSFGFPMGLIGVNQNLAITRTGIISRIRDCISHNTKYFLIDANIFPGNSGGPVILKPETTFIRGTTAIQRAYLIGIIAQYYTYNQTMNVNDTQVVFRENSGIGLAFPVDFIEETINQYMQSLTATQPLANPTEHTE